MKFVIEHLSKSFEKKEVLRDIDFTFDEGKIYGLLGRNGAGKTTLFNCLNRDLKADSGNFYIEDENGVRREVSAEDIGYVLSTPTVPEFLTGREFLKFFMDINEKSIKNPKSIDEYFDYMSIEPEDRDKLLKDYSHGMKNKMQIKMSYKGTHKIEGFFEYVVPPLEGLWWQENTKGLDYARKEDMHFISMIRLPDFVTKEDFEWAVEEATKKKKQDFSKVEFFPYDEGLCVQCMHIGSYDDEPATVDLMHDYMKANGYELDITDTRYHHEIYLSDPRKCDVSRLKTVVRHPIRKAE